MTNDHHVKKPEMLVMPTQKKIKKAPPPLLPSPLPYSLRHGGGKEGQWPKGGGEGRKKGGKKGISKMKKTGVVAFVEDW